VLGDPAAARAELTRFVATFVRPNGANLPSTLVLADAIERFGGTAAPAAAAATFGEVLLRAMLYPVALFASVFPEEALRKGRPARWLYEQRRSLERAGRRARKHLVERPSRRLRGARQSSSLMIRRAVQQVTRQVGMGTRRASRSARQVRYAVATKMRRTFRLRGSGRDATPAPRADEGKVTR
jgi:hypothetical protein